MQEGSAQLPAKTPKRSARRTVVWACVGIAFLAGAGWAYRWRARTTYVTDRLEIAHHALHHGNAADAEAPLKEALAANPRSFPAHQMLASMYESMDEQDKAHAQLRAAVKVLPRNAEAHYALATFCIADKRYPEAIAEFKGVLSLDPRNRMARHLLARCHMWDGQPEKAVQVFKDILADDPRDQAAESGLATAKAKLGAAKFRAGAPASR